MPVWHRETAAWRKSGDVQLIGITQEQHPDRCRLFAQWQGIDWPILWDPFNLTGSVAVPFGVAIDEHGVVREAVRDVGRLAETFVGKRFDPPADAERADLFAPEPRGSLTPEHFRALEALLWKGEAAMNDSIGALERLAAERKSDPALLFHAGVARRMRSDSTLARSGDFQAAIDHWAGARRIDPNQYIWRRRIQQYGPRLDKPYPFYTWVQQAREELRARGETPVPLRAELTGSELAGARRGFDAASDGEAPDPDGKIHRDAEQLVALETAVAWDTSGKSATATLHVTLRPNALRDVHWTNDVEPLCVWIGDGGLPEGWKASRRLLVHADPAAETSAEVRHLDLELQLPDGAPAGRLSGYALYYVCEGATGECVFRRQDFTVELGGS